MYYKAAHTISSAIEMNTFFVHVRYVRTKQHVFKKPECKIRTESRDNNENDIVQ